MLPKFDEFSVLMSVVMPHIIVLCETWAHDDISDEQIRPPRYCKPFRCDRTGNKRGGGVCILLRDDVNGTQMTNLPPCPHSIESIWIKIPTFKIILLALYVPPNLRKDMYKAIAEFFISNADTALDSFPDAKLVVAGDLNHLPTEDIELTLSLKQIVTLPTRGNSILDKILIDSSLEDKYAPPIIGPSIGKSDHQTVLLKPHQRDYYVTQIKKVYDYRQSNMARVITKLKRFPWHMFYRSDYSLDQKCEHFYQIIDEAMDQLPFTYVEMSEKDKPWMTPMLKHLINQRFAAYREKDFGRYSHYKTNVTKEIIKAKNAWVEKMKTTKQGIWNFVNTKSLSRGQLQSAIQNYSRIDLAADAINESLAESFSPSPDWSAIRDSLSSQNPQIPWAFDISQDFVLDSILKLNVNKAPGSDNLHPRVLRAAHSVLLGPLTHLIALSLETREVPNKWKMANVVPVPKKTFASLKDF